MNEEDQAEQHVLLNELSRLLRFSPDERQSCSLLRESQHLLKNPDKSNVNASAIDGGANATGNEGWCLGQPGRDGAPNREAALDSLEKQWLSFLQFRRWGELPTLIDAVGQYHCDWDVGTVYRHSHNLSRCRC